MDPKEEIQDEILGRWLSGDLTKEELEDLKKHPSFKSFELIDHYSKELETPGINKETVYASISSHIHQQKSKSQTIKVNFYKRIAIAASILVVLGTGLFFMLQGNDTAMMEFNTTQAEIQSLTLPAQSTVTLNASSSVSYSEENWKERRSIELKGEAYFEVTKGSPFVVSTNHGSIEVLGTKFNIRNRDQLTEVTCYEGKVRVTATDQSARILTKGETVRIVNGSLDEHWSPVFTDEVEWKNGSSSFHLVPLQTVIKELENQYKIKVVCNADISDRSYVGAFPHDNLEQALKLVFEPMQLNYTLSENNVVTIE